MPLRLCRGDRAKVLFKIPWAAIFRIAEAAHDLQQPGQSALGVMDQIVGHRSSLRFASSGTGLRDQPAGVQPTVVANRIAGCAKGGLV